MFDFEKYHIVAPVKDSESAFEDSKYITLGTNAFSCHKKLLSSRTLLYFASKIIRICNSIAVEKVRRDLKCSWKKKNAELRSSTEKCFAVLVIISGIAAERLEKANMARLIFVKKSPIETDAFLALAIMN